MCRRMSTYEPRGGESSDGEASLAINLASTLPCLAMLWSALVFPVVRLTPCDRQRFGANSPVVLNESCPMKPGPCVRCRCSVLALEFCSSCRQAGKNTPDSLALLLSLAPEVYFVSMMSECVDTCLAPGCTYFSLGDAQEGVPGPAPNEEPAAGRRKGVVQPPSVSCG